MLGHGAIPSRMVVDMSVLAVVVTYNPADDVMTLVDSLLKQCSQVLVVDNGSRNRTALRGFVCGAGAQWIGNERNEGLARALNQALDVAGAMCCDWLLAFDQDACVDDAFVARAVHALAGVTPSEVAAAGLRHCDERGNEICNPLDNRLGKAGGEGWEVRALITSATFFSVPIAARVGGFNEEMFVDLVDHEYCLRARKSGFRVVLLDGAPLVHRLGACRVHRLLFLHVTASHHSALRRYYMVRNQLHLSTRYAFFDPVWSVMGLWRLICGAATAVLVEESSVRKAKAMALGLIDCLSGQLGVCRRVL